MFSIRRALLLSIIRTTTLVLLVAAAFSYRSGLREADELFDAKLAHSSRVLMSLMDAPLDALPPRQPGAAADPPACLPDGWCHPGLRYAARTGDGL